jgi:PiT family inorganic phosphate transporter
VLTGVCYLFFRTLRSRLGVVEESCLCIGNEIVEVVPLSDSTFAMQRVERLSLKFGNEITCHIRYSGTILGMNAATTLGCLHYLSAGVVSFARGLNDTPKIAALLLVAPLVGGFTSTAFVGVLISLGGILGTRRVAETMSQKITTMNHEQGFTANLITGAVVLLASRFGMPVSTTHVSCGSLFGIGAVTGRAKWKMITRILSAWVTTLPLSAIISATLFLLIKSF